MHSSSKGDEEAVNLVSDLKREIENYSNIFSSISKILDTSLIRFNAVVNPTSENKLKAFSIPSMREMRNDISELIEMAETTSNYIVEHILELEKAVETSRIKCSYCKGNGKISRQLYHREEGMIQQYSVEDACPKCEGKGYREISEDIISLIKDLIGELRKYRRLT